MVQTRSGKETSLSDTCGWPSCHKPANTTCSRGCTVSYCSRECEEKHWNRGHGKLCGKKAYTFTIELLDSRDPVISRTVEVPAWYTFEKLHYIIQYGFSWRQSHMHEFTFPDLVPDPEDDDVLISKGTALEIKNPMSLEFPDDFENPPEWPMAYEHHTKLSDVYDPDGKFYKVVWRDGTFFLPLMYTYDFGDNWEHDITHVSEGPVLVDRPIFSEATGYGPLDDSGGIEGWEEIKKAFKVQRPTESQRELRAWAFEQLGLEEGEEDPSSLEIGAYNPHHTPSLDVLNAAGKWQHFLQGFS